MKTNLSKPQVGVVMGSDSDWPLMEATVKTLERFGVRSETRVISAHRTPELATAYAAGAARRGLQVIIAAAGGAAHLAGVLAAHTILPVIGVPVKSGALDGLDALLSTVQMPSGIPVATVALGSAGAVNAAILAIQILALRRPELTVKLQQYKRDLKTKVKKGNAQVQCYTGKIHD
ncbi:MAG: 5-(carboxyamino)imidazole ribonucleotide mutase [Kiritimatiellaeota bacterium]|nr:5-(carboxyamino)imidazole ribonucleotide mutase [Kiritimatiellota bacterium]